MGPAGHICAEGFGYGAKRSGTGAVPLPQSCAPIHVRAVVERLAFPLTKVQEPGGHVGRTVGVAPDEQH